MKNQLERQSFLGVNSDEILERSRVGIIGLGGGGSHIVQQLAHLGVGNFILCDPDKIENSNLNRLVGATLSDARKKTFKVDVAESVIRNLNPKADIKKFSEKWQNQAPFLRECDAIFGCVDSLSERDQLEVFTRRHIIPYLDIGMDVCAVNSQHYIGGQVILSMPGNLCMRCLGYINDKDLREEAPRYGSAGSKPQVVWPNGLLASIAVGIFIQLVTPWHSKNFATIYFEYDGNTNLVSPSPRFEFMKERTCEHFASIDGLGSPSWKREG